MKVIFNKSFIPATTPVIYHHDRGFLFGDGLFETIKAEKRNLLFFHEHYNRLSKSAEKLGIPFNTSMLELKMQCKKLLEMNNLRKAAIRITLTRGSADRGIQSLYSVPSNLLITAVPYIEPTNIHPTTWITDIKRNEYSLLPKLKTLNFLEPILSRQQAKEKGYAEGIMLNSKGAVTETSIGNLFAVINHKIFTPKIEDGLLPGIVRQTIINIAIKKGIPLEEKTLYPEDLLKATELFQTNSLIEIQSFSKINEHLLSVDTQESVTAIIINTYQKDKDNHTF